MRPKRIIWSRAALAILAGAALATLYLFTVERTGFMPRCLFKQLTGWSCPGCGSQRALHAITEGKFMEALGYNYMLPFTIAFVALCGMHWILPDNLRIEKAYRKLTSPASLYVILGIVATWTILRNICGV